MTSAIIDPTLSGRINVHSAIGRTFRPETLSGARICLLDNGKRNAAEILDALGDQLTSDFPGAVIVRKAKKQFAMPLEEDFLAELKNDCDAVIVGVGDCGSCSAAAVADGIVLEQLGMPVAVICTVAFKEPSKAMARLKGDPEFPFILTQHPIANLTAEQIRRRGQDLAPEVTGQLVGERVLAGSVR